MKTIKLSLIGLLSLFITVLLIKYAIISYNYITIDFTTLDSAKVGEPVIYNFGLTFFIQMLVLLTLAVLSISISIGAFVLAHKYYKQGSISRRNKQLIDHIEEERYNELRSKLRNLKSADQKEGYVEEYLKGKHIKLEVTADIVKEHNKRTLQRVSLDDAINEAMKVYPMTPKDAYKPIEFEPKEKNITWRGNSFSDNKDNNNPRD